MKPSIIWLVLARVALQDVSVAVRHGDEANLFARFVLALLHLTVLGHVGYLTDEAGRTGLATRIGVYLGIHDDHLDRFTGGHQAGEVLEANVVHGSITTQGDHGRAEQPFFVGKLLPVEVGEEVVVFAGVVFAAQLQLSLADHFEAVGHLGHMAFEDTHRHGG
jgi:hypothetical protein